MIKYRPSNIQALLLQQIALRACTNICQLLMAVSTGHDGANTEDDKARMVNASLAPAAAPHSHLNVSPTPSMRQSSPADSLCYPEQAQP